MNTRTRFAGLAAVLLVTIVASASPMWAQQVRLAARRNKVITGIEAELRGSYRATTSPIQLNSELDNINIPVGTPVAFRLLQNGVKTLLGVGQITLVGGTPTAVVELSANDGDVIPTVSAGDVLHARQRLVAPFNGIPPAVQPCWLPLPSSDESARGE